MLKEMKEEIQKIDKMANAMARKFFICTDFGYHPSKSRPHAVRYRDQKNITLGSFNSQADANECAHAIDRFVKFETSTEENFDEVFEKLKGVKYECPVCNKPIFGEYVMDDAFEKHHIEYGYCSDECAEKDICSNHNILIKTLLAKWRKEGVDFRPDDNFSKVWMMFPDGYPGVKMAEVLRHEKQISPIIFEEYRRLHTHE